MRLGPGRPLLADSARRWAGALLACCAVLVAVLGALFAHQTQAGGLDRAIDAPFVSLAGAHPGPALWLASLGSLLPAAVLSAAVVAGCLATGQLNGAVLAATAVPVSVGLTEGVLKPLFHRTLLGHLTYPSGHTTVVCTLAATLTVLLLVPPAPARARSLRVLIAAAACALSGLVVLAVVGLRWHYFTDAIGGAAVAAGTVFGLALVLDLPLVRRWLSRATGRVSPDRDPVPLPASSRS